MGLKPLLGSLYQTIKRGINGVIVSGTPTSGQVPTATSGTAATWQTPSGGSGSSQLPAWTYTAGAISAGLFTTSDASIAATTQITLGSGMLPASSSNFWSTMPLGSGLVLTNSSGLVSSFTITAIGDGGTGAIQLNVTLQSAGETNWSGKYTASFSPAKQTAADVGLGNVDNTSDANKPISTAQATSIAVVAAVADLATTAASTAQTTADAAATAAATAESDANTANNAAVAAQADADAAQASADAAIAVAITADTGWTANADGGDKTSAIPANATLDAMQAALNLVVAGFGDAFVAVADKTKAIETALTNKLRPNV